MGYINIDGQTLAAIVGTEKKNDTWHGRETSSVTLTMSTDGAKALFTDGVLWSYVWENNNGETVEEDMSAYSMAGDVIDHRDGTVTVVMGKPMATEELTNALEQAYELLYGGDAI